MADSNSNRRNHRFVDLMGKRFGKWTVIDRATNHPSKKVYWICQCECGTTRSVRGDLLTGDRSHGCNPCGKRSHGMTDTPEYCSWHHMKQRCHNPNLKAFADYGGNGVVICERWKSFQNFYADIGPQPSASHSVDRIDGSKGYSCGHCDECIKNGWTANCRWATPKEQSINRSCVQMIEFNGITQSIPDWAKQIGIPRSTLNSRLSKGWSIERALTEPVKNSNESESQTG